jgi:hypothetical protein
MGSNEALAALRTRGDWGSCEAGRCCVANGALACCRGAGKQAAFAVAGVAAAVETTVMLGSRRASTELWMSAARSPWLRVRTLAST